MSASLTWLLDGIAAVPDVEPRTVLDLTADSREARSGSLFFALPGRTVHGLKFAAEAAARGAGVVLWEPSAEVDVPTLPATVFAAGIPGLTDLVGRIADRFFRDLRARIDTDVVLEPRHASWFAPDVDDWLATRRIARVAADPARIAGAGELGGWNELAYYRWHGSPRIYYSEYDDATLAALAKCLVRQRAAGVPTWCIFDNTVLGAALGHALALTAQV